MLIGRNMDFYFLTCQIWQFLRSFQILFPIEVLDLGKAISTTHPQVHTQSFVLTWDCFTAEIFKFLFPILIIRLLFPPIPFTYCIYTYFCFLKKKKRNLQGFISLIGFSFLFGRSFQSLLLSLPIWYSQPITWSPRWTMSLNPLPHCRFITTIICPN